MSDIDDIISLCKAFHHIKNFCLSYSTCIFKKLLIRDFNLDFCETAPVETSPLEMYFKLQLDNFKNYIENDDNISYNGVIKYVEQFKLFNQLSILFKYIELQNYIHYIFSNMSKFYCSLKKIESNNDFDSVNFKIRILEKKNIFTKLPFLFIKNGYFVDNLFIESVIVMEKKSVKLLIQTRPEINYFNSETDYYDKPILFQLKDIVVELDIMKKHIKLKQYIYTIMNILKKKGAQIFWKINPNKNIFLDEYYPSSDEDNKEFIIKNLR